MNLLDIPIEVLIYFADRYLVMFDMCNFLSTCKFLFNSLQTYKISHMDYSLLRISDNVLKQLDSYIHSIDISFDVVTNKFNDLTNTIIYLCNVYYGDLYFLTSRPIHVAWIIGIGMRLDFHTSLENQEIGDCYINLDIIDVCNCENIKIGNLNIYVISDYNLLPKISNNCLCVVYDYKEHIDLNIETIRVCYLKYDICPDKYTVSSLIGHKEVLYGRIWTIYAPRQPRIRYRCKNIDGKGTFFTRERMIKVPNVYFVREKIEEICYEVVKLSEDIETDLTKINKYGHININDVDCRYLKIKYMNK